MQIFESCVNKEIEMTENLQKAFHQSTISIDPPYYDIAKWIIARLNDQFKDLVDKDFFDWWLFECYYRKDMRKLYETLPDGTKNEISIKTPEELAEYLFD